MHDQSLRAGKQAVLEEMERDNHAAWCAYHRLGARGLATEELYVLHLRKYSEEQLGRTSLQPGAWQD